MKTKLTVTTLTSVRTSLQITVIKVAAICGIVLFVGALFFTYLNLGINESAKAGKESGGNESIPDCVNDVNEEFALLHRMNAPNVSYGESKKHNSPVWTISPMSDYFVIQFDNEGVEYSLELFDMNGFRVANYLGIRSSEIRVKKSELFQGGNYTYALSNTKGDLFVGDVPTSFTVGFAEAF